MLKNISCFFLILLIIACENSPVAFEKYDYKQHKSARVKMKKFDTAVEVGSDKLYMKRKWQLYKDPPRVNKENNSDKEKSVTEEVDESIDKMQDRRDSSVVGSEKGEEEYGQPLKRLGGGF